VTIGPLTRAIKLLEAATATNGVPSGATAGVNVSDLIRTGSPTQGLIHVASTAGSVTMTVTLKLWGYLAASAVWTPIGTSGTDANRGLLNGGTAIGELAAPGDTLRHSEVINAPWAVDRVYIEITAIGGTATAVSAWIVVPAQQS
jgi:hypothetical protein